MSIGRKLRACPVGLIGLSEAVVKGETLPFLLKAGFRYWHQGRRLICSTRWAIGGFEVVWLGKRKANGRVRLASHSWQSSFELQRPLFMSSIILCRVTDGRLVVTF
jgi:hypothetical protein